jgi:hypothetical protein
MFELKFMFFVVFLPLVVVLLFSVAWSSFVRFCGYGSNDFRWLGNHYGHSNQGINPATVLPMVGGVDAGGNFYGQNNTQINPATGLPMVGGIGGIDAGGNCYGHNSRG